ncbi:MAG: glycosyltransferase family 2 protein [Phycisphaerales bacterium]
MHIDLLIPAHNESLNIDPLFDAIERVQPDLIRRVVLIDNASTDDTAALATKRGAIVLHEMHRGYGAACLAGINWLGSNQPPDVLVFLDADLSDDPAALPRLLQPIFSGDAVLVIGSRVRLAEAGALNVAQRFGNRLACMLMFMATGKRYRDLGPFRAISWNALEQLHMQDRTWGWTVEMQMKAAMQQLRVAEVDVPYRTRHAGKSKISGTVRGVVAAGWKIITTIILLRLR